MGELAEILRANLRELAHSQARTLRGIDAELQAARGSADFSDVNQSESIKALLGKGSFTQQTVKTLKGLCKANGIKGISKLKKAQLVVVLEEAGIEPPPRPIENFSKKELILLVKQLLNL